MSFKNTCCAVNTTSQDIYVYILYLIVYDFTNFRCAKNHAPQDHFRCVMVCYRTHTFQKTRPDTIVFVLKLYLFCIQHVKAILAALL